MAVAFASALPTEEEVDKVMRKADENIRARLGEHAARRYSAKLGKVATRGGTRKITKEWAI